MVVIYLFICFFFFFQAEDGIRDLTVTGVQTCALPISFARSVVHSSAQRAVVRQGADYQRACWRGHGHPEELCRLRRERKSGGAQENCRRTSRVIGALCKCRSRATQGGTASCGNTAQRRT